VLVAGLAAAAGLAWDADRVAVDRLDPEQPAYECVTCGIVHDARHLPCACGGEPTLAALPRRLGAKFLIERRLGRGGMGVVYLARDLAIGRLVALKTLPALRRGVAAHLRDEARAMAALRHDGLATIYGLESWRHCPVLVVEYFPHGTLAQRLTRGALTPAETRDLGIALARTLTYMHGKGVLHGDLKPSNVAFSASGAPVLLDFGLATLLEPGVDDPVVAGTSAYLPPETLGGAPASPAVDLWSLAVVLLEAVSGAGPVPADERSALMARVIDPDLATVLRGALESAPERRFRTSLELETALKRIGV
jgi:eukaryotic-like serine/threonine-protein kinase